MLDTITDLCREVPDHLRCRHIFDDGHRCGTYSLRNETFCYYHHADRKPVPDPQARHARRNPITLPPPTSRAAIQEAIGRVITSLASNDIDRRRAGTLLYGLQLAALNIARHCENLPHTEESPAPTDLHPSPQAEDLLSPKPVTLPPASPFRSEAEEPAVPSTHPSIPAPATHPFTEEVFPLPQPKLHRLEQPYFALLLGALAQHLNVEPSPGTPEDRRPETDESVLPIVQAVGTTLYPQRLIRTLPPCNFRARISTSSGVTIATHANAATARLPFCRSHRLTRKRARMHLASGEWIHADSDQQRQTRHSPLETLQLCRNRTEPHTPPI